MSTYYYLRYEQTTHILLDSGKLNDTLIDGTLRNQPIYGDLAGLAKTVGTVHGLRIIGRIPVMIIEDDSVSSCQIDSQTAGSCTEQEYEDVGAKLA